MDVFQSKVYLYWRWNAMFMEGDSSMYTNYNFIQLVYMESVLLTEGCRGEGGFFNSEGERLRNGTPVKKYPQVEIQLPANDTEINEGRGIAKKDHIHYNYLIFQKPTLSERLPGTFETKTNFFRC